MSTTTTAKPSISSTNMATDARIQPNQSLYIQNLPEKLQKHDLKRSLYMLFSTFGPVLDITAVKTSKMRGQAHVLFRDVHAASQAMRACQGFEFYGREMKISYAKEKSKTLSKMTGQYDPPLQPGQSEQKAQPANAFPPPPGHAPPGVATGVPPPGVPPPGLAPPAGAENAPSPQGTKRPREDSDNEDAPMDEEGSEMEMSDDE
ncbi:hypothetical protein Q7P37_002893 [Cladosporium fusiforme]